MEFNTINKSTRETYGNLNTPQDGIIGKIIDGARVTLGFVFDIANSTLDFLGTLKFTGGGLIFGTMYIPGVDIIVTGSATPVEVKDDGTTAVNDGWAGGDVNQVTFPTTAGSKHYLPVTVAGKYEVIWSMSAHTGSGGATTMHGGIMIDGVAQRNNGEGHRNVSNSNDDGNTGSPGTVDCPNGTEQISLWILSENAADIHVEHGTMTIKQIGGT